MKILHVITSLRIGGAERLVVDLIPRLKVAGHTVDLMIFDGIDTPLKQQAKDAGINIIELGKGGKLYSSYLPSRLFRMRPYIKDYDIIHTHNYAPQLFVAIMASMRKHFLVTTEHGGSNRRRSIKPFKMLDRWMYDKYHRVICIADKTREDLLAYLGCNDGGRFVTINNGVDVKSFAEAKPSEELEKTAPNSRKMIMVAGFRWEKDHPTVIKSLKFMPSNFHLFLVGDGIRRSEYEKLAQELSISERVHFLGLRTDVPELLKAADYIIMSSHFEGLSLSSVEGMAVGKPFLASDVDGLREVVGGAGILFPHEDAQALAEHILQLEYDHEAYINIADKCSKQAYMYDSGKMFSNYEFLYNSLIS